MTEKAPKITLDKINHPLAKELDKWIDDNYYIPKNFEAMGEVIDIDKIEQLLVVLLGEIECLEAKNIKLKELLEGE